MKTPHSCTFCKRPFDAAQWPRSKYTATGWSPWCPEHHALFAAEPGNPLRYNNRRGPKPKRVDPPQVRLNRAKTHCKHGHEFNAENTRVTKRNTRQCRVCERLRQQGVQL
jgi:hypothetical protein